MNTQHAPTLCRNCGEIIPEGAVVSVDDLGPFLNCPKCGGSQDTDAPHKGAK